MNFPLVDKQALALLALKHAREFAIAGVDEKTGHNDGVQIDKFEKVFGLQGQSWCAMFQYWCYAKAYCDLATIPYNAQNAVDVFTACLDHLNSRYVLFSPSCGTMIQGAKLRGIFHEYTQASDMLKIKPGHYVMYDWKKGTDTPERHIGIFDHAVVPWLHSGNQFVDVEGNTSSGDAGSQSNGGGAFIRHRLADPACILGWISTY